MCILFELASKDLKKLWTSHPMIVAMNNGEVGEVYTHPSDNEISINLKKGIVSELQNSLPVLSLSASSVSHVEVRIENFFINMISCYGYLSHCNFYFSIFSISLRLFHILQ